MKEYKNRIFSLLMVVLMVASMACGALICSYNVNAASSKDEENHRKLKDPEVELEEPVAATQLCRTAIGTQKDPIDYYYGSYVIGATQSYVNEKTYKAAMRRVSNLLTNIGALGSSMGDIELASAATNPYKMVTADVISIIDIVANTKIGDDNKYDVTIGAGDLRAGDKILIIHFTHAGWENIVPTGVENGKVHFKADSLSPFAVIRFNITDIIPGL